MINVLVVHGAGIDMRGKSQVNLFGSMTMAYYDENINRYASRLGVEVDIFHSNIEGEIINKLYQSHSGDVHAALINPAGFTTGYPALTAAIRQVRFPTFEIHVSNPISRGIVSEVGSSCRGVITGCGLYGYYLGLKAAINTIEQDR